MLLSSSTSNLPPHRHPFAGASKAERPLYFEKTARDRHSLAALSAAAPVEPDFVSFPPDEERGRKFKPTLSAPAILDVSLADPSASTFGAATSGPASDGDDDEWAPGFPDEDLSIAQAAEDDELDDDLRARERANKEADRQRAEWGAALEKALDEGKTSTDIELR